MMLSEMINAFLLMEMHVRVTIWELKVGGSTGRQQSGWDAIFGDAGLEREEGETEEGFVGQEAEEEHN